MKPLIVAEKLSRTYHSGLEEVHAVEEANLTVERGDLTIFCGPSGSGKTTLINLLGALDTPSSGNIFFDGTEITSMSESEQDFLRRKRMGFVFQSIGLISIMSAYENIEFGLRVSGFARGERKERAEYCLQIVGMHKRMYHRPFELSGGEQQRVAIARAIAHSPDIIFADEPTSALDTMLGIKVLNLFKELSEEMGMTVVMTTHDPNFRELADHVYTLRDGKIAGDVKR
ncbi:MAG: ABC transporter ATP-binding protein [Spirochaetales bacterium]|nr:ABC transporter ATP-binding protein [Spirochaetales bacterium]